MDFRTRLAGAVIIGGAIGMGAASAAIAGKAVDTSALRAAVTVDGIRAHQQALQDIANLNGGHRAAGSQGYADSVDYVAMELLLAGYNVEIQGFPFPFFEELSAPVLERVKPTAIVFPADDPDGFNSMLYSGSGSVPETTVEAVDLVLPPGANANTSTSGCEPSDFAGFTPGNIALIQRGTCTFLLKAQNAEAAGAVGVVIFNEGQPGRTEAINGTLGQPSVTIPVVGASHDVGLVLNVAGATAIMEVNAISEFKFAENVLAETPGGRDDRVVVVGAHLDSVPGGPGINDNGSGTATILEIARQMSALGIQPTNKVRFAFWGAEEFGLLGSEFYVGNLSDREIKDIALNLNFDMLGSPNFVRFVYDGDGSDTPLAGPNGSGRIEEVFLDYFSSQGLATEATAFDGRSDYGPFIAVGIPAGGLFSGAEGVKTDEQAAVYGGTAGESYDPCYHLACDTFDNNANEVLDQFADATAHAVLTFAQTSAAVNGTARGGVSAKAMDFRGSKAQR